MYGAKLRLFFDNTKLFGLYFAFSCKLFQYILHLIRQIFHSSVLNLLRNTESGFGDTANDGSDGIAIAAMRYLSLIHISEPTRQESLSRMPSSA